MKIKGGKKGFLAAREAAARAAWANPVIRWTPERGFFAESGIHPYEGEWRYAEILVYRDTQTGQICPRPADYDYWAGVIADAIEARAAAPANHEEP